MELGVRKDDLDLLNKLLSQVASPLRSDMCLCVCTWVHVGVLCARQIYMCVSTVFV